MSDQMRNFLPKKPAGFELGLPESQPRRWPLDHHHGPTIRPSWFRNRPLISTLTNEARFRERRNDVATLRRASNSSKSFPMRVSKPNLKLTFQKRRRQNSNCGRRHGHCRRHHRRRCGRRRRCRTHYRRPCRRRQLKQCLATGPFFTPGDQEILGQLLLDFETRIMDMQNNKFNA